MAYCAAVICMDGRIQVPVNKFLTEYLSIKYVDTITEAGAVKYLADEKNAYQTEAIIERVKISINAHNSRTVAVAAHHDCAGNQVKEHIQKKQLHKAESFLKESLADNDINILKLWVDADWKVNLITH